MLLDLSRVGGLACLLGPLPLQCAWISILWISGVIAGKYFGDYGVFLAAA